MSTAPAARPLVAIPIETFQDRVFLAQRRVEFSHCDSYGHLNGARALDMIVDHRFTVFEDLMGLPTRELAQLGVGFYNRKCSIEYLRPSFMGDTLELASWLEDLGSASFTVTALMVDAKSRKVRARCELTVATVDPATGRSIKVPAQLFGLVGADERVAQLVRRVDYTATIKA